MFAKIMFPIVVFGFALGMMTPAQATGGEFTTQIIAPTSCDQRAPRVELDFSKSAQRVGYGSPNSDMIYWLDTDGVSSGSHRYTLARQPFGSAREWVMVAAFEGDQGLYTSPTLTFTRPVRNECVAKQNPRFDSYKPGINTVCGEDSLTTYLVTVKVRAGTPGYILKPGTAELVQRNDRQLSGEGYLVKGTDKRRAEYYVYAGRFSRLKLDPSENGAWPVKTSSDDVQLVSSVYRTCQEELANE